MRTWLDVMRGEMGLVLTSTLIRLVVAALLGGAIGLQRQLRHKPAGLRTNMFICFGAAMFTVLSAQLAGSPSESSRIASQIIPGIGFIGAGSILHSRGSVMGLTTAATLFVVAGVGMAAGGGLYLTAVFATAVILLALAVLGRLESRFSLRSLVNTYEVTGRTADAVLQEVSRIVQQQELALQTVTSASGSEGVRMTFAVNGARDDLQAFSLLLHQSSVFAGVLTLGSVEHE